MTNRLGNNALFSMQGIVFEFLVALEYCLKMKKGDIIYIERFGEITSHSENDPNIQIEVKRRKDKLSNYSDCIWNTIYNWMQQEFDISIYYWLHFAEMSIKSGARKLGIDRVADDISETLINREAGL